ncbi:hypothetical protein FisN_3Lh536 [Fistulifera solaris]|uniref:Uncharacterized protein n=1 Tax=Fistulifera solaris TaxID=1519565 RepID=A0A1Z5J8P8_FISSO|nr:hypothetical protein FisN_3Lh536 [Fistulifera solaris]|eukprot:GAX10329.1 hypothetical protein FisN_3Lh536 [Fistulifera solaris]
MRSFIPSTMTSTSNSTPKIARRRSMPKSITTDSTEPSSVCSRIQMMLTSLSDRTLMNSNSTDRQSLSQTLSRTFSLRYFHNKTGKAKANVSIPKEISVGTRKEFRKEAVKRANPCSPKKAKIVTPIEIHVNGLDTASTFTPKDVTVDLRKTATMKKILSTSIDASPTEICIESLWTSPKNDNNRRKETKQSVASPSPSIKKQITIPLLMSPQKSPPPRAVLARSLLENQPNDAAWKLEKPPILFSRASPPSRTVSRYASSQNLVSVHATPARPEMYKQTSVYIPKADLDKLCNMYDDIVDTPFRAH